MQNARRLRGRRARMRAARLCMLRHRRCHAGMHGAEELGDFGDLGFGFKSFIKKAVKVASMPVKLALKAANATSNVLCSGGGVQGDSKDAKTAQAFCKAVKTKNAVTMRRLLPAATAIAAKAAKATKTEATYNVVAQHYTGSTTAPAPEYDDQLGDTDLLAALDGADQESLAFALSGVDPNEIGAAMTRSDLVALAPASIAVAAGLWMFFRG